MSLAERIAASSSFKIDVETIFNNILKAANDGAKNVHQDQGQSLRNAAEAMRILADVFGVDPEPVTTVEEAVAVLGRELKEDEGLLLAWQANLATAMMDVGIEVTAAQKASMLFLERAFGLNLGVTLDAPEAEVTSEEGELP